MRYNSETCIGKQARLKSWLNLVRASLSFRLVLLTILFVMIAEILIYLPSIAQFRLAWIKNLMAQSHIAALTAEASGTTNMIEPEKEAMRYAGTLRISMTDAKRAVTLVMPGNILEPERIYNIADTSLPTLIVDAFRTFTAPTGRIIRVTGASPKDKKITLTVDFEENSLKKDMIEYSNFIFDQSLLISIFTAFLILLSLILLITRPILALTERIVAFGANPEDPTGTLRPTQRRDEIGLAHNTLVGMQHALRAALHQQNRLAALGAAVGRIHHDLGGILATAALVSERLERSDDPEVRQAAELLLTSIDRAMDLSQQTLAFARDGVLPLQMTQERLSLLVEAIASEVDAWSRRMTGGRRLYWINQLAPTLTAEVDREQLSRVLSNLARNAISAGATTLTVRAPPPPCPEVLSIHVSDNGPGLPAVVRDHLFDPFRHGKSGTGTGLGLAIAREIMRRHAGDLTLGHTGPEGTTFVLTLPQAITAS